jgi:hypothetical protein
MAVGYECPFDRVGRAKVLPALGGEVLEGEHHVATPDQAFDRLVVFWLVDVRESVEDGFGVVRCPHCKLGADVLMVQPTKHRLSFDTRSCSR